MTLRRAGLGGAGTLALLMFSAPQARGQVSAFVDLGSGNASYDGVPGTTILALSPYLSWQHPRWAVAATGSYTTFDRGGWSGQGSVAASWLTPRLGSMVIEFATRADHSLRAWGSGTGQALAQSRAHFYGPQRGMWVGMAAGRAWQAGENASVIRADAGLWASLLQDARLMLGLSRGRTFDTVMVSDVAPGELGVERVAIAFTEANGSFEWAAGPFELSGGVARRVSARPGVLVSWNASGTYWITSLIGVIAGVGRYSPDAWQALPGGRYATLSLRVGLQPQVRDRLRPRSDRALAEAMTFEVVQTAEGEWLLLVRAPRARLVEVAGDFSDWQPLRLFSAGDGTWMLRVPMSEGVYRINVRLDGGRWAAPPGMGAEEDEFNGRVGVLVLVKS